MCNCMPAECVDYIGKLERELGSLNKELELLKISYKKLSTNITSILDHLMSDLMDNN